MTTTVKLRTQFNNPGGGVAYPGDKINIDDDTARNLIRSGAAVAVVRTRPAKDPVIAQPPMATKPVTDTPALKGFAKLHWLRKRIRELGGTPKGRTIVALTDELQAID